MGTFGRRTISIIMSVIMVLSYFAGMTFSVGAETSGDYQYSELDDGTIEIFHYEGNDSKVIIPSEIDGKTVTKISLYDCFEYSQVFNGSVRSVTIPNSIKVIGYRAFYNCYNLEKIILTDSVTEIGEEAFWQCSSLENITIPNSVTKIGIGAFADCVFLSDMTIPDSVVQIDAEVFDGCRSLKSINVSENNKN